MAAVREFMGRLREKLEEHQQAAGEIDAVYKFDLQGEQGSAWVLSLRPPVAIEESQADAECTITMDAKDFVDMFEGQVNGQQLFFAGKLRIDGDMALALKLQQLTELLRS